MNVGVNDLGDGSAEFGIGLVGADGFGSGDDTGVACRAEFGGAFFDEGDHVASADVVVVHCFVTWRISMSVGRRGGNRC